MDTVNRSRSQPQYIYSLPTDTMDTKHQANNSKRTSTIYNKIPQGLTSFFCETKKLYNRVIIKLDNIFTKSTTFASNQFNKALYTIKKISNYCINSKEFKLILARTLLMIIMYAIYYSIIGGYNGL